MSFLKITDTEKRDQVVKELSESKKRIQQNHLSEKIGDSNLQIDLSKLYKPLIDSQSGIKEDISKLQDQANQFALTFSNAYPEILTYGSKETFLMDPKDLMPSDEFLKLGKTATDYFRMYTYSTPGLWELLTKSNPNKEIYNIDDLHNYRDIIIQTDAITTDSGKPKSSRGEKYKEIIAPIWKELKRTRMLEYQRESKGTGIGLIILPSDPTALVDMYELRIAAWRAGNTGSRNEAVAICDELLRQGVMNSDQYKAIQNNLAI
ncbi:uncharacterized protein LOC136079150 [Hydra vulgaris]|uniref:Uncharacterized protein LOC136079150 n=1 Tax=Hydra vulgaris TaxID=6087 RepID=A0ABM4BPB2_HYDVU